MKPQAMLEELERVAEALSVKVTYEALSAGIGSGGLCRVKGAWRVIIDKRAQTADRVATLARALSGLDSAGVSMPVPVRRLLDRYALPRAS